MATYAQLRRFGLTLPGAAEVIHFGQSWLVVGKKTFALWSQSHGRAIMKLDREHQQFLFEIRSDAFTPCKVGTGGIWSYVDLAKLTKKEVEALTLEAWTQIVPKKTSAFFTSPNRVRPTPQSQARRKLRRKPTSTSAAVPPRRCR